MEKVLIFGGLNEWRSTVIDQLLLQGLEVTVTYQSDDEETEERALAFGRNALFNLISLDHREQWKKAVQDVEGLLFFDAIHNESNDESTDQLSYCLINGERLKKIILLSYLAANSVSPRVQQLEKCFIETFDRYKNGLPAKELVIIRTPDFFTNN